MISIRRISQVMVANKTRMIFGSRRVLSTGESKIKSSWDITERFRKLGREYGRAGIIVYLGMSTTTFSLIYLAIWNGVDVEKMILEKIKKAKAALPSDQQTPVSSANADENGGNEEETGTAFEQMDLPDESIKRPEWSIERVGTTFLVAFAANKLLSPLKAMLTVFITPSLVKWFRYRKFPK